ETKGHMINALLLPSNEYQNTIRRLEDELQEVRQAYHIAISKSNKLTTISESVEYDSNNNNNNDNNEKSICNKINNDDDDTSSSEITYPSDKLEQNVDENVKELEERVKYLEVQLINAKKVQQIPTLRSFSLTSVSCPTDPTQ